MKIAFVSNFLNHHQLPICEELVRLTDGAFTFVALTPVPGDRLSLGYYDMNEEYPFVIRAYESDEEMKKGHCVAEEADILIIGGIHDPIAHTFILPRVQANKISFWYCERRYKRGLLRALSPKNLSIIKNCHNAHKSDKVYMLCASAYTAWDYALTRSYIGKTFKWGYFPKVEQYDVNELIARKRQDGKTKIMWCARFIPWKHPEAMLTLAKKLKDDGEDFVIEMVGNGEMFDDFKRTVEKEGLSDLIHLMGSMSPKDVREHMKAANIFVFTSDFNEGWGAVLNESMNSACAVISGYAIGSTPFLVSHESNGFVYKTGNDESIYRAVKRLIDDPALCDEMGKRAYNTMLSKWSPEAAAERLMTLATYLEKGEHTPYESGPCSEAPRMAQRKMYRYLTK